MKLFLRRTLHPCQARLTRVVFGCLPLWLFLFAAPCPAATNWLSLSELLKKWEPVSLAEIQRQAEGGDASAQHYLGYCYSEGFRVAQDPAQGASWYRRAFQAGYLPSANNLGFLYQRGLLGTNDYSKAVYYYRLAAERGLAQSQMNLGVLYRDGIGVPADPKEALRWFRLAADQGHAGAMVEIGRSYRFGRGVKADPSEAIRWFEKAAEEKNSSLARLNLGLLYQDNHEARKAISWYQKAAEQGQTDAMIQLYFCYWDGSGLATDHAKAMEWLRKAADANNPYAECLMGYRCESVEWVGEGKDRHLTRPDLQGALRWYRRSAEQGWAGGQYHLGLMYLDGKAVAVDEARALDLIRAAADQNLEDAVTELARLYACGIGEPRNDNERPMALLQRTGQWQDLMLRYEHGLGTERDLVMAARCYAKLVLRGSWTYSRHDLSDMIEFKPATGGSSARRLIEPLDHHLTILGPPHRADADASDDVLRMLSLYLKSARGDGAAAYRIGEFYEKGQNTPKSAPSAWAWFSVAARNENAAAAYENRVLEKQMSAEELKLAQKRLSDLATDLKEVGAALR